MQEKLEFATMERTLASRAAKSAAFATFKGPAASPLASSPHFFKNHCRTSYNCHCCHPSTEFLVSLSHSSRTGLSTCTELHYQVSLTLTGLPSSPMVLE